MNPRSRARKTKIVATLGPASSSPDIIRQLILAGVNVFRLNFSHGDHEFHGRMIEAIRSISASEGACVGILQDLGGPKIRLGELAERSVCLKSGDTIQLIPGKASSVPTVLPVEYDYLLEEVGVGDRILLADGTIELVVERKGEGSLIARVIVGGEVRSHKGVNLPSGGLKVQAITSKDMIDLEFGIEKGVDFVAISFVRHEKDLDPVLRRFENLDNRPLLIAKIEKPQALNRLNQILERADGIMVARGDLGIEMPLEKVPLAQKTIIKSAVRLAKPVITATQMLGSMTNSPRPTRAETTDVANAILDGTDAVMLSEETAIGRYPVETVRMMNRIAVETESHFENFFIRRHTDVEDGSIEGAVGQAAWMAATNLRAAALVASTASGATARLMSKYRPKTPIVAITHKETTYRQLSLSWGVIPLLTGKFKNTDDMFNVAKKWMLEKGYAGKGDCIVVTAGVPVGVAGTTNLIKVIRL
ncbi:MAG TPA: pyruvate kinase [Thermodesulforhabdus norvegica]|uniref:Pyruvate kinase n=1 Tax=Thermodesulforhabdus norvegica TaxID=39841 RepID=A0A7C0WVJ0_9BACT|nr:pyruvate kinase [Thermodesulforhabdus norvegica]